MRRRIVIAAATAAALPTLVHGQSPLTGPTTLLIPFAPGGASDVVARTIADGIGAELGRTVIVENKGGAGGLLAADAVGRSAPDGRTLLYGNQGQMIVARHLMPGNGVNPLELLTPVAMTARTSFLLVVPTQSPHRSVGDVVAAAKSQRLRFGIPGIGTPPHMATALFGEATASTPEVIPYQGSGPVLIDLVAGRLDVAFDNVASSLPQVRAGKLRALGIASATRSLVAAEVPTLAESGVENFAYQAWQGVFAPRATPQAVLALLEDALLRSLRAEAARQKLEGLGLDVAGLGRSALQALIAREAADWDAKIQKGLLKAI